MPRPWWPGWSAWGTGASTRSSIGASWPCGVRSWTCSARPPTCPVRIDLWGDEVDRLSEFSVGDQRSTDDLTEIELFGCRELLPTAGGPGAGQPAGRRGALGPPAVGAPGRGPGLRRHGVLAAVADRATSTCSSTFCPPTPWSCWSSPAACATGPPSCSTRRPPWPAPWPRRGAPAARSSPASTCRSIACWPTPTPPSSTVTAAPEGPGTEVVAAAGWDPVVGDGERLMGQLRSLQADGLPDRGVRRGSGQRRPAGRPARRSRPARPVPRGPAPRPQLTDPGHPGRAPTPRARLPLPAAQAGRAGRGRPHRPAPGPPPAPAPGPATPRPSSTT